MTRVLIAYDGSPCAEAAIQDLTHTGLGPSLDVLVLSVADVWLPPEPAPGSTPFPAPSPAALKARAQAQSAVAAARAVAEKARDRLRSQFPGWKVEAHACADSPAWGVLGKATEWKADLVILGSHGRSTLERLFLGSVSQKVAAEAPCSVRIARPRSEASNDGLRIVVALDGSPDSLAAAAAAAARPWPKGTACHLVSVLDARLETGLAWPDPFAPQWTQSLDAGAKEVVTRVLEHGAQAWQEAGWTVETHLLTGEPKHELLAHADRWKADAIFLGARGLHHGGRLALGTMASAVAGRAHCSVEIVRRR